MAGHGQPHYVPPKYPKTTYPGGYKTKPKRKDANGGYKTGPKTTGVDGGYKTGPKTTGVNGGFKRRPVSAQPRLDRVPPYLDQGAAMSQPWRAHPNYASATGLTPEQIAAQGKLTQPWQRDKWVPPSGLSAADRALINHTEPGTATDPAIRNAAIINHYRNATANGTLAAGVPKLSYAQQAEIISGRDYVANLGAGVDPQATIGLPSPSTSGNGNGAAAAPSGTAAPAVAAAPPSYQDQQQALIDQQLNDALSAIGAQFSTLLADLERQRTEGSAQIDQAHQAAVDALGGIDQRALARDSINQADQQAYAAQGSQMLGADANNIMAALQASGVDVSQLQGRLAEQQGFAQQQSTIQGDLLRNLAGVAATGRSQNSALAELIQQGSSGDLANNVAQLQSQLAVQQAQQEAAARQQALGAQYTLNQDMNKQRREDELAAQEAAAKAASAAGSHARAVNKLDYAVSFWGIDPALAQAAQAAGGKALDNLIKDAQAGGEDPGWNEVYTDNGKLAEDHLAANAAGDLPMSDGQKMAAFLAVGAMGSGSAASSGSSGASSLPSVSGHTATPEESAAAFLARMQNGESGVDFIKGLNPVPALQDAGQSAADAAAQLWRAFIGK